MTESKTPKKLYAPEIYKDKALLERLGYGIMDVESNSGVGYEDVHKFTYLTDPQQSSHFHRNLLHELTGRYYPDRLSHLLWPELAAYKLQQEQATGQKMDIKQAASQYFD